MKKLSFQLVCLRKKMKKTQQDIADELNISVRTYRAFEKGDFSSLYKSDLVKRMSSVFNAEFRFVMKPDHEKSINMLKKVIASLVEEMEDVET